MKRLTIRNDGEFAEDEIIYSNPTDPEGAYNMLDLAQRIDDGDGAEAGILLDISNRLAAYEDTGLAPEEITTLKEACGGDVKVDSAIEAIMCRKEAAVANLERFKLQNERDTLKKALELACERIEQLEKMDGGESAAFEIESTFLKQVQEQDGQE